MPEVFGDHLLVARIGGRSMTDVFVAVKLGDRSGKTVVVKRPRIGERASSAAAEALRREAEVLAEGGLRGVARLIAAGEVAGLPFVAIEHVHGVPLDRLLESGPLDDPTALLLARDVGRALAAVHARGWVHGDVAPANVLIDDAGEVVLVDFGLARRVGESREAPAGKPGYVAPEVALAKPAAVTDDVYAWGALVAECFSGKQLFPELDLAEAAARTSVLPKPIAARAWLRDALSLDPSKRPSLGEIDTMLSVAPGARGVLASRVEALCAGRSLEGEASPGGAVVAARATAGVRRTRPAVERERAGVGGPTASAQPRFLIPLLAGGLVIALTLAFFAGRRAGPRTATTIATAAPAQSAAITLPMIPANSQVYLDGKSFLVPERGRRVPIEPGRHTIRLEVHRREAADYDFVAEPGDHVLVVTVPRAQKGGKP